MIYIRKYQKPIFIEFITYRWLEHCGPYYDYELNRTYRKKNEVEYWKKACPINNLRKKLVTKLKTNKIILIENDVKKFVKNNYLKALKAEFPKNKDLKTNA